VPIKHSAGGTIITGDSQYYFRLCQMKGAVGLELKGIRRTRGPVVWRRVKREFGITGNKQAVYDWLVAKVDELRPQQEHIVTEGGRTVRMVGGEEVN